jgi:uncharacterized 2Fe-2S/4Fe-4S cluster protein (DUF4445 family)
MPTIRDLPACLRRTFSQQQKGGKISLLEGAIEASAYTQSMMLAYGNKCMHTELAIMAGKLNALEGVLKSKR